MTKDELIKSIYEKTDGITRARINDVINALIDSIHTSERLYINGLGTFKHVVRAARKGRNPATGASMDIPEKTVLTFKASR